MELEVGQWVTGYSPGIWQISRIATFADLDPRTGHDARKTSIFMKRLVSRQFKRSFSVESCAPSLVTPIDPDTNQRITQYIRDNPKVYSEFVRYQKPVDAVYNAPITALRDVPAEQVQAKLSGPTKYRTSEIQPLLSSLGLERRDSFGWTAQFVSKDHEINAGYLVFQFARILKS